MLSSRKASDRPTNGRSVQPDTSALAARHATLSGCHEHPVRRCATVQPTESIEPTRRAPPFTSQRFHVLFNSLFKVLFNFPSRYLFAIGLAVIFSLRRSLPPTLGCILKQPDSEETQSAKPARQHWPDTSSGKSLDQKNAGTHGHTQRDSYTLHFGKPQGQADSALDSFRFTRRY